MTAAPLRRRPSRYIVAAVTNVVIPNSHRVVQSGSIAATFLTGYVDATVQCLHCLVLRNGLSHQLVKLAEILSIRRMDRVFETVVERRKLKRLMTPPGRSG